MKGFTLELGRISLFRDRADNGGTISVGLKIPKGEEALEVLDSVLPKLWASQGGHGQK